jgi:hypothetical protein
MFLKKLWKRLHCEHEFKTKTNLYGDAIDTFGTGKKVIRSIKTCTKCGKIIYSEFLDPNCKAVNNID